MQGFGWRPSVERFTQIGRQRWIAPAVAPLVPEEVAVETGEDRLERLDARLGQQDRSRTVELNALLALAGGQRIPLLSLAHNDDQPQRRKEIEVCGCLCQRRGTHELRRLERLWPQDTPA